MNKNFDLVIYFSDINVNDQKFNQELIKKKCKFKSKFLRLGFNIFKRSIRFGIIKIIKNEKPDIIICSEYGQITIEIAIQKILFHKKYTLYAMSDDSINEIISRKGIRKIIRNNIEKIVNGIIVTSKDISNWHKKYISQKIKTIELPIIYNEKYFIKILIRSRKIAEKYIEKYNIENKKVVLFVGRLENIKNVHFLVETFNELLEENIKLFIIGEGSERKKLEKIANSGKRKSDIKFIGRLEGDELIAWYTIADIFVLPSIVERFGVVVNEALLGGCMVLCSNKAGASILIDKNNGELFCPYNKNEFKEKIEKRLSQIEIVKYREKCKRPGKMNIKFNSVMKLFIEKL